jgi:hypothetical protein
MAWRSQVWVCTCCKRSFRTPKRRQKSCSSWARSHEHRRELTRNLLQWFRLGCRKPVRKNRLRKNRLRKNRLRKNRLRKNRLRRDRLLEPSSVRPKNQPPKRLLELKNQHRNQHRNRCLESQPVPLRSKHPFRDPRRVLQNRHNLEQQCLWPSRAVLSGSNSRLALRCQRPNRG